MLWSLKRQTCKGDFEGGFYDRQKKIQLENGTILFLGAAAFILLAASLFPSSAMSQKVRSYLEMNRMVERAFAVMLLVLSTQLMKRKRTAWEMTMAVLTLSLLRGLEEIIHTGLEARSLFLLVQAAVFFILLWSRKIFAVRPLKSRWNRLLALSSYPCWE